MNAEEKLKSNIRFLFKAQLAFENYEDDRTIQVPLMREIYAEHGNFRKTRNSLSINEQIKITDEIAKKYNDAFDIVGRNNFIFYDDGDINYIWKGEKNNG